MTSRLHIAHFIHRYPPALGGSEAYFERLTEHFRSIGHKIDVWTSTARTLDDFRRNATEPLPTEPGLRRYRPLTFPFRRPILKVLSLLSPPLGSMLLQPSSPTLPVMLRDIECYDGPLDAVHATAFPYGFPLACAYRLARRRRVPLLLTPFLHLGNPANPGDRTRKQYSSRPLVWLLKKADAVFVQTPSEFEFAAKLGVERSKLVLQGLGVEPAECTGGDRESVRRQWGVTDETTVVGHLANLSVEKGTIDLVAAAEDLPNCRVVLAGPEMPNFTCSRLPLSVAKLGVLSEQQKRDFFAGIDLFVLPSRTDSFGLVLLEAWANGKPVIAYRAGGPAELVRHDVDGLLVDCGDVDGLRCAIGRMIASRELRSRLGEAGRARTSGEFAWKPKLDLVAETVRRTIRTSSS